MLHWIPVGDLYFDFSIKSETNCTIRIEGVEKEDEGTWECKITYENKDGESVDEENDFFLEVANYLEEKPTVELNCSMPDDGAKIQVCSWRNGGEGAFKSSFKKSHEDRIR